MRIGLLVLVLLAAGCTEGQTGTKTSPAASSTNAAATVPAASEAQRVKIEVEGLEADPAALVASASGVTAEQARQLFPPGTNVEASQPSWAPDGTGSGGTIDITVQQPGAPPARYVAVMVKESGAWKVLATVPIESTSTARP